MHVSQYSRLLCTVSATLCSLPLFAAEVMPLGTAVWTVTPAPEGNIRNVNFKDEVQKLKNKLGKGDKPEESTSESAASPGNNSTRAACRPNSDVVVELEKDE